ncbi:MAG: ABC transporter substrate-binding protein [Clostridia bacterium]|nr:ABC transporter substrate-binding protein [Clostridia bacterium]
MFSSKKMKYLAVTAIILAVCSLFASCTAQNTANTSTELNLSRFIKFPGTEPSSVDPQVISENFTVPINIFDRLVENAVSEDGKTAIAPSLAKSWNVSDDGLEYTFYLREGVYFSNGSMLEADDVLFTFTRLISNPDSKNRDLVMCIHGADALKNGETSKLEGFEIIDDLTFKITLNHPYAAFLEALTSPAASILDRTVTTDAGDDFGKLPGMTAGTGPFILNKWASNREIVMVANENYWGGAPKCEGLRMMFYSESDPLRTMFLDGELDILDLDKLGMDAEYFIRGDIYRKNLVKGDRVGITFIALNQSVEPLDDVRVRKALQTSLDRKTILRAAAEGKGYIENGILPHSLKGYDPDLEEIPFDVEAAKALLAEAGYAGGFDLDLYYSDTSSGSDKDILELASSMWSKIGVRATVRELPAAEFNEMKKAGKLSCYVGSWNANYNDPDDFVYTFFGNADNSLSNSLCYYDEDVFERAHHARAILNEDERLEEYRDLQKKIVVEDAAWIPLFSKLHFYVVSGKVGGFSMSWNGWSSVKFTGTYFIDGEKVIRQ